MVFNLATSHFYTYYMIYQFFPLKGLCASCCYDYLVFWRSKYYWNLTPFTQNHIYRSKKFLEKIHEIFLHPIPALAGLARAKWAVNHLFMNRLKKFIFWVKTVKTDTKRRKKYLFTKSSIFITVFT